MSEDNMFMTEAHLKGPYDIQDGNPPVGVNII